MAPAANTIYLRIMALLCIVAILLVALPPVTCAASAGHSMAKMPAAHCDPCCNAAHISATAPCCLAHPQPSEPVAQASQPAALLTSALPVLPSERLATTRVIRAIILRSPPPPLRTNLRI